MKSKAGGAPRVERSSVNPLIQHMRYGWYSQVGHFHGAQMWAAVQVFYYQHVQITPKAANLRELFQGFGSVELGTRFAEWCRKLPIWAVDGRCDE